MFWSAVSVNFLLKKYYNYLNNIDMALLRTSYMYGGFHNVVRFGVCMIKLRHERMLILRCILPPKNWITSRKKVTPPATTWKISNTLTRSSRHWEYLNLMRNLKLLEKYQPNPPPPSKKENLNLQKKNEKTSLIVKVSTTLKLPQPLWKSLKPLTWTFSISQK